MPTKLQTHPERKSQPRALFLGFCLCCCLLAYHLPSTSHTTPLNQWLILPGNIHSPSEPSGMLSNSSDGPIHWIPRTQLKGRAVPSSECTQGQGDIIATPARLPHPMLHLAMSPCALSHSIKEQYEWTEDGGGKHPGCSAQSIERLVESIHLLNLPDSLPFISGHCRSLGQVGLDVLSKLMHTLIKPAFSFVPDPAIRVAKQAFWSS